MSIKWTVALMMAFVIFSLLAGVIEQEYLGSNKVGLLQQLMTAPEVTTINNPLTVVFTFVKVLWNIVKVLWAAFWWDYAFFQGYWVIFKYAIFWPISIALILALVMAVRGVGSG